MKSFVCLLVVSFMLNGCDLPGSNNSVTLAQLETQLKDIQNFVSKGNCSQAGECSYLAIGSKACGGPAGYIVFSNNIDVDALKQMVERYTEDQKTYNKENNVISDCSLANPPEKLDCLDGSCIEIR